MPDETIDIPTPVGGAGGNDSTGDNDMAETTTLPADDYAMWKSDLFECRSRARDGINYAVEALRLGFQEGKVGYRESLAIRTVGQPGVAGSTDTSPK